MTTNRIQYKKIEQIAAKHDVGVERTKVEVDGGMKMITVPAVRLSGFLANIQASVRDIQSISSRYYSMQREDGLYLYV